MYYKTLIIAVGLLVLLSVSSISQTPTLYVPQGLNGIGYSAIGGHVGIGTNGPVEKLQVAGNIKVDGYIRGNQGGDALQIGATNSGYVIIGPQSSLYCEFTTDRSSYLFDKDIKLSTGRLTTVSNELILSAGDARLTLNSRDNFGSFSTSLFFPFYKWFGFGPPLEDNPRLLLHHTGTHGYIDYQDNLHFRANKNWISALTCYGDGTVGVGFETTYNQGDYRVPEGFKFAVNGGIICEEVQVIADVPDADYVFDKEYELMTLGDLEAFIQDNNHLPGIPSADEFICNGYKVGEMDEMLLRKIEELTLYVIELKKENDLLNRRIEMIEEGTAK